MLKSLTIDNFAIISNLNIEWTEGLNIVTGQTGAGKSIIMGAIALLSGQKADVSLLLDDKRNLVVEAVFDIRGYSLGSFFADNDIDPTEEITLRRQVSPLGKSRCFVDDVPVSVSTMKELSESLIDIHSQHESILLTREKFQMDMLDSISATRTIRDKVQEVYSNYESLLKETESLRIEVENTERERNFISFQIEELSSLHIVAGEMNSLLERLSVIEHSEDIARSLSSAYDILEGSDNAVCNSVQYLSRTLFSAAKYMASLSALSERLSSCSIELRDIASEADNILSGLSFDQQEKERIEKRVDDLNNAMAKHGVNSEDDLLKKYEELQSRLDSLDGKRELLTELDRKTASTYGELVAACDKLSELRRQNCSSIESYVISTLSKLGIDKAGFSINMSSKEPSSDGSDNVEFLFSANANSSLQPISKVASGGEISRLMLALKSMAATKMKLPTMVFDEIDTGVSGAVADSMGEMICSMANSMQIINITHLPQVAAKGSTHYEVYKENSSTRILRLSNKQRIEKIAEMLSGADVTDAARQQAMQLLGL